MPSVATFLEQRIPRKRLRQYCARAGRRSEDLEQDLALLIVEQPTVSDREIHEYVQRQVKQWHFLDKLLTGEEAIGFIADAPIRRVNRVHLCRDSRTTLCGAKIDAGRVRGKLATAATLTDVTCRRCRQALEPKAPRKPRVRRPSPHKPRAPRPKTHPKFFTPRRNAILDFLAARGRDGATVEDITRALPDTRCCIDADVRWLLQQGLIYISGARAIRGPGRRPNIYRTETAMSTATPLPRTTSQHAPARHRLPTDRVGRVHKFKVGGFGGYIRIGEYPDGSLGEVFIKMSKSGSLLSGMIDSFATVLSVALQYGVPLEVLADKFVDSRFEPFGITGNPDIPEASSIVDYIFKYLLLNYGKKKRDEPKE